MRLPVSTRRLLSFAAVATAALLVSTSLTAQSKAGATNGASHPTVQPAEMQKLLPSPAGWTKGVVQTQRVVLSETASYTFAYALYTQDTMKIRVTIADTGLDEGALATLATMIMTFPDTYAGQIPPATTIKRSTYKGASAAELWDANTSEGEFTVLVDGRFVVKVEGTRLTDAAIPRAIVDAIDLQSLKTLK